MAAVLKYLKELSVEDRLVWVSSGEQYGNNRKVAFSLV